MAQEPIIRPAPHPLVKAANEAVAKMNAAAQKERDIANLTSHNYNPNLHSQASAAQLRLDAAREAELARAEVAKANAALAEYNRQQREANQNKPG